MSERHACRLLGLARSTKRLSGAEVGTGSSSAKALEGVSGPTHALWLLPAREPAASRPNEKWAMEFVTDSVSTGRVIRMLTVLDSLKVGECNRDVTPSTHNEEHIQHKHERCLYLAKGVRRGAK
jgi:hypothetical protein